MESRVQGRGRRRKRGSDILSAYPLPWALIRAPVGFYQTLMRQSSVGSHRLRSLSVPISLFSEFRHSSKGKVLRFHRSQDCDTSGLGLGPSERSGPPCYPRQSAPVVTKGLIWPLAVDITAHGSITCSISAAIHVAGPR